MADQDSHSSHEADSTEQEHKKSWRRSWRTSGPVAKLTVVFSGIAAGATVIYAIAAIFQFIAMSGQLTEIKKGGADTHDLAVAAKKQADVAEAAARPYIGEGGVHIVYLSRPKANGEKMQSLVPTKTTNEITFQFEVRNFGPLPGTNFRAGWRVFFGGKEISLEGGGDQSIPQTLNPGQYTHFDGSMDGTAYKALMNGTKLIVEISVEYDGPRGHYGGCQQDQYQPGAGFVGGLEKCHPPN